MRIIIAILCALAVTGASAAKAPVRIEDATVMWVPAIGQIPRAGFFRITNTGADPIEIAGARSSFFASVDFREAPDGDAVIMEQLEMPQPVAPGETMVFRRGGRHLLMSVESGALEPGDTVDVDLLFNGYDDMTVTFTVRKVAPGNVAE